jgi:hypothetical protein
MVEIFQLTNSDSSLLLVSSLFYLLSSGRAIVIFFYSYLGDGSALVAAETVSSIFISTKELWFWIRGLARWLAVSRMF